MLDRTATATALMKTPPLPRLLPVLLVPALGIGLASGGLAQDEPAPTDPKPADSGSQVPDSADTPGMAPAVGAPPNGNSGLGEQGLAREVMWQAPTAADWEKPMLIPWQRTWEDAKQIALETGKAILICVNMDGEIASEHYAGIRYRQPEVAKLYEKYVPVIASVYRHTARDYDEDGKRIPCPRFGHVTCGEHITLEPFLYQRYFEGTRVAPRHIMIELDESGETEGSESYDVYYAFSTAAVFDAIHDGVAERVNQPTVIARGDRSIVERVASKDAADRDAVEQAYAEGDAETRRALLEAAARAGGDTPVDLLRLAVFGLDREMAKQARQALVSAESEKAVGLLADALQAPTDATERDALIAALDKLGDKSADARLLGVVHKGLVADSTQVDLSKWSTALQGAAYPAPGETLQPLEGLEARLDETARVAREAKADPVAWTNRAVATLTHAASPETARSLAAEPRSAEAYSQLQFDDARSQAERAKAQGATGWQIEATLALCDFYAGNKPAAYERAEAGVDGIPEGDSSWLAMASLALWAESRQEMIRAALRKKDEWPSQWLTDVNAAYAVLSKHPLGIDAHVVAHVDFLRRLGASGPAERALSAGLERFPASALIHDRRLDQLLANGGPAGAEAAYEKDVAEAEQIRKVADNLYWFAGYGHLVAAESWRRLRNADRARAAYRRSIALFEQNIESFPDSKDSADHYVALAHGALGRLAMLDGRYEQAIDEILASFARREASAATLDGLNLSTVDTAKTLRARLVTTGEDDLRAKLEAAMGALDAELLELPAYETSGQGQGGTGR